MLLLHVLFACWNKYTTTTTTTTTTNTTTTMTIGIARICCEEGQSWKLCHVMGHSWRTLGQVQQWLEPLDD